MERQSPNIADSVINDSVIQVQSDVITNINQTTVDSSRVTCPQCKASGNLTIFVCNKNNCEAKFCEHCKDENYPRQCLSCIHIERSNAYRIQQEKDRALFAEMEAAAREQKLKEYAEKKELERKSTELSQRMADVLIEEALAEQKIIQLNSEMSYERDTKGFSSGLFIISSIIVFIYFSTFGWDNIWSNIGKLTIFSLISLSIFIIINLVSSVLKIKLSSQRILALAASILSPLLGIFIISSVINEQMISNYNYGTIGCCSLFVVIVYIQSWL